MTEPTDPPPADPGLHLLRQARAGDFAAFEALVGRSSNWTTSIGR